MSEAASFPRMLLQKGFTLTELIVGLAVSLILLTVVSQIYVSARTTYRYQSELAEIQEAGRFALELIGQDAKSAGFQGCGEISVLANVMNNSTTSWWLDMARPIRAFNSTTGFPADLTNIVTTSDAVAFIRTDNISEGLVIAHDPVPTRAGYVVNTTNTPLPVEMVGGVQAMRIYYGVDDDGDLSANRFLRAHEVDALGLLGKVVSLRVEIVIRSQGNALSSTNQTYIFDGASVTASDRRIYKVFSTTLNLRNRTS